MKRPESNQSNLSSTKRNLHEKSDWLGSGTIETNENGAITGVTIDNKHAVFHVALKDKIEPVCPIDRESMRAADQVEKPKIVMSEADDPDQRVYLEWEHSDDSITRMSLGALSLREIKGYNPED